MTPRERRDSAWLEALAAHVRPEIVLPALRELPGIGR